MTAVLGFLHTSTKMSSIDEGKLSKRKASLEDCLSLVEVIDKQVRASHKGHDVQTAIGATLILTGLVSDIIRDTVGAELSSTNYLMKRGLEEIYDKARDKKWEGNKYESTIKEISKNTGYLETLLNQFGGKGPSAEMVKMTIAVHKQMAMNVMGLKGFVEDGNESRQALELSLAALKAHITKISAELERVNFYLQTGEGAKQEPRMSMAKPKPLA